MNILEQRPQHGHSWARRQHCTFCLGEKSHTICTLVTPLTITSGPPQNDSQTCQAATNLQTWQSLAGCFRCWKSIRGRHSPALWAPARQAVWWRDGPLGGFHRRRGALPLGRQGDMLIKYHSLHEYVACGPAGDVYLLSLWDLRSIHVKLQREAGLLWLACDSESWSESVYNREGNKNAKYD